MGSASNDNHLRKLEYFHSVTATKKPRTKKERRRFEKMISPESDNRWAKKNKQH